MIGPNVPPTSPRAYIPVRGDLETTSQRLEEGAIVPVNGPAATITTFSGPKNPERRYTYGTSFQAKPGQKPFDE
jgi:hypothetical protein